MLHHNLKELDNDLGGRTNKNLTLTTLLSIRNADKAVIEYTHQNHVWKLEKGEEKRQSKSE